MNPNNNGSGPSSPNHSFHGDTSDQEQQTSFPPVVDWSSRPIENGYIHHPVRGWVQHPSNYNHPVTGRGLCRYGRCRCPVGTNCDKTRLDEAARSIVRHGVHRADAAALWGVPQGLAEIRSNTFALQESSLPSYMLNDEESVPISSDSDSSRSGSSRSGSSRSGSSRSGSSKSGSKKSGSSKSGSKKSGSKKSSSSKSGSKKSGSKKSGSKKSGSKKSGSKKSGSKKSGSNQSGSNNSRKRNRGGGPTSDEITPVRRSQHGRSWENIS